MLFFETIDVKTLELLRRIQGIPVFSGLCLVGGTSLALQIGHRKSVDLDLFGEISGDEFSISKELNALGNVIQLKKSENINMYSINDIKVDIVNYPYKWIDEKIVHDEIILAGKKDIAAMKLAAVTGRGTKKDFIDIYFLLQNFTIEDLLFFYNNKYDDGSEFMVLKSLIYFEDANEDETPFMLAPIDWQQIKSSIKTKVEKYISDY